MNNFLDIVGWCLLIAKEEKVFIEVRVEFFLLVFLWGFFIKN